MPSFLIVNCSALDARTDAFVQPPTIDIAGMQAILDWGDVTLEVLPGDLPVTIWVQTASGGLEGAVMTVRVLPETGTRISFAPPQAPGAPSMLHVDGQWPSDAAMAYYAARDARVLAPNPAPGVARPLPPQTQPDANGWGSVQPAPTSVSPQPEPPASPPRPASPSEPEPPSASAQQHPWQAMAQRSRAPQAPQPPQASFAPVVASPAVPPVGPEIGSTGAVPPAPTHPAAAAFGQQQGAVVEPGHAAAPHHAPHHHQGHAQPGAVRKDAYGRDRVAGDRSAPAIPTPSEYEQFANSRDDQQHAQQVAAQSQQQGWYPDPYRRAELRWFDSERWTSSVMRGGRRERDQL